MILGGGSNCQGCGCGGACPKCTRTCQNPHSGSAFQEVWRGWSFGAVEGRATDGYLTFSGDEDNPAFISGGGPFHQEIGGTFYLDSSANRFPCAVTVSFWRTLFPADASTDTALSSNTVTITCVTGQFITAGGVVLNPGETYSFSDAVPLVGIFAGDPHSSTGTFGGYATCDGTMVSIRARIDWSSSERIHVLHGIVRECYEEGSPCNNYCADLKDVPKNIYVTLSSLALTNARSAYGGASAAMASFNSALAAINGTPVVLSRSPYICNLWETTLSGSDPFSWSGSLCRLYMAYSSFTGGLQLIAPVNFVYAGTGVPLGGCNESLSIYFQLSVPCISGTTYDQTGTISATDNAAVSSNFGSYGGILMDAAAGWRIQS
jgi:hypothetical protein